MDIFTLEEEKNKLELEYADNLLVLREKEIDEINSEDAIIFDELKKIDIEFEQSNIKLNELYSTQAIEQDKILQWIWTKSEKDAKIKSLNKKYEVKEKILMDEKNKFFESINDRKAKLAQKVSKYTEDINKKYIDMRDKLDNEKTEKLNKIYDKIFELKFNNVEKKDSK